MPELPQAKRERYVQELGLATDDAVALTQQLELAQYFEDVRHSRSLSNGKADRQRSKVRGDVGNGRTFWGA